METPEAFAQGHGALVHTLFKRGLKGSFREDLDLDTGIDIDIDSDMGVSITWGSLKGSQIPPGLI